MFITEEEYAKLDYAKFSEVLERLHNKAIEDTLKLLPDIIIGLIVKTKGMRDIYARFKEAHPDFKGSDKEMLEAIEAIELSDGSLTLPEILEKVPAYMRDISLSVPTGQPKTVEETERITNGFI